MHYLSDLNISNRNNNLNIIRMFAATSVLFGHAMVLNDGKKLILWGVNSGNFGFLAVAVFFFISGFLITQSFEKSKSIEKFLEARVLRIFPGLIFATILSVVLIALFGKNIPPIAHTAQFILQSVTLKNDSYHNYFATNPIQAVNGSLWTLGYEFRYYIVTMVIGLSGLLKRRYIYSILIGLITFLFCIKIEPGFAVFKYVLSMPDEANGTLLSLPLCYFGGSLVFLFKEYVPISILGAVVLLLLNLICSSWIFLCLSWGYAAIVLGFHPSLFIRQGVVLDDLSYGIYITSFPIQQLLVSNYPTIGKTSLFIASFALTLTASWVSWRYVEEPALSYRGRLFRAIKNKLSGRVPT